MYPETTTRYQGFTLIELLVVISIISLLSSVVLSTLNSARDRARISAGLQFAQTLDGVAGDQAVGMWDFNECSGVTMSDRSGYGNGGAIASGISWSNMSPNNQGCSIVMNGTAPITYAGGSTNVPAYQLGTGNLTVAGWIYPTANPSCSHNVNVLSSWGNPVRMALGMNCNGNVAGMMIDSAGTNKSFSTSQKIPLNRWTFLAMVVDRSANVVSIYINGTATSVSNFSISGMAGNLNLNGPLLSGASAGGTTGYLTGNITKVRLYAKTLTATEIGALYAIESEGLPTVASR